MATSAQYNPAVIQEFAQRLYTQADRLVITWALRFGILGALFGLVVSVAVTRNDSLAAPAAGLVGLVGALFGASYGRERGFELRLRAQEALCLLQTEINTRKAAALEVRS